MQEKIDIEEPQTKYCVFMDVLGYGNIVLNKSMTASDKINWLNNYFTSIASSMMIAINEVNQNIKDKIYIRSFSDSFYLETKNLVALLHVCNQILNDTFGFYANINDEYHYTPLLRAGMAKGWTVLFIDVGAIVNNQSGSNPIGTGIAKSYGLCEKTKLSGMRFIIEDAVFRDLQCSVKQIDGEEYFLKEYSYCNIIHTILFQKIIRNEVFMSSVNGITLYEMIWPIRNLDNCSLETIDLLIGLKKNFTNKNIRHFKMTAKLFYKALQLTDCKESSKEPYKKALKKLYQEYSLTLFDKLKFALQHILKS